MGSDQSSGTVISITFDGTSRTIKLTICQLLGFTDYFSSIFLYIPNTYHEKLMSLMNLHFIDLSCTLSWFT